MGIQRTMYLMMGSKLTKKQGDTIWELNNFRDNFTDEDGEMTELTMVFDDKNTFIGKILYSYDVQEEPPPVVIDINRLKSERDDVSLRLRGVLSQFGVRSVSDPELHAFVLYN